MHVHPQQVISRYKIFMSDWPHVHVQAHMFITLSCTSEDWEGSVLGSDTNSLYDLRQLPHSVSIKLLQPYPAEKQEDFLFLLPCLFLLQDPEDKVCYSVCLCTVPSTTRSQSCQGLEAQHIQKTTPRALGLLCKPTHTTVPCNRDTTESPHFKLGIPVPQHTKSCFFITR